MRLERARTLKLWDWDPTRVKKVGLNKVGLTRVPRLARFANLNLHELPYKFGNIDLCTSFM